MRKRPTVLVGIGVIVFVLGAAIVLVSLHPSRSATGAALTSRVGGNLTPVVVATRDLAAGTTGEAMIEDHEVALRRASAGAYRSDDLTSLAALNQEALSGPVASGQPIASSDLRLDAGVLSTPAGDESLSLSFSAPAPGLAAYLSPGSKVDVYATVTSYSAPKNQTSSMPVPCTALVASGVEVLDVSDQVQPWREDPTSSGRAVPSSITILVAATPTAARDLIFYATSAQLYLAEPAPGATPAAGGTCAALIASPTLTPQP